MANLFEELAWRELVYDATDGVADLLSTRVEYGVHRLRSDGVEPARRSPAAADGTRAAAALRSHADRHRRRRDGDDRRSERQVAGAEPADGGADRSQRRRHAPAARTVPGLRQRPQPGADRQQRRLARNRRSPLVPARRRQTLHRELHAPEGVGEPPARERGRALVHRVQLPRCCRHSTSCSCSIATAARCRSAAAISGATSLPASI